MSNQKISEFFPARSGVALFGLIVAGLALVASLSGNPGLTGTTPGLAFVAGGLSLVLASILLPYCGLNRVSKLSLLYLAFVLFGLASLKGSLCIFLTKLALANLIGGLGLYLLVQLCVSGSPGLWRLASSGFASLIAVSNLYAFRLYAQSPQTALKGNFTNPDCYAVVCLLGFFASTGLAVEARSRLSLLWGSSAIVNLLALVLTGSRSALLGVLVGYGLFLLTLGSSRQTQWRSLAVKLFVLPAALSLLMVLSGGSLSLGEKLSRLFRGADSMAVASRVDVLVSGTHTVMRAPLFGSGLGCFHLAYQQDRGLRSSSEDYMNVAHNDYMQLAVEAGIPAALIWICFMVGSLWVAWCSYRSPTPWVAAQLGSVTGMAICSALNPAVPVSGVFYSMAVSLALTAALARLKPVEPRGRLASGLLALVLLVLAAWTVDFGWRCFRVLRMEMLADRLGRVLDWEGESATLQAAINSMPDDPALHLRLAGLSRRAYVFTGKDTWLEIEDSELIKAYRSNPRSLQVLARCARALEERGQLVEARRYWLLAQQYAPYSPQVQRALVANYVRSHKYVSAAKGLADTSKTGVVINDEALGALIFELEQHGKRKAEELLTGLDDTRALKVGLVAARAAVDAQKSELAQRLLALLETRFPNHPELVVLRAQAVGMAGDQVRELKILEKLRRNQEIAANEEVEDRVWQRWAELRVKEKQYDLVTTQLEDYLISHPRRNWARSKLSEIYLAQGRKAESRAALRAGIPYDDNGSIRLQLGDLCVSQGLPELARGYYREALAFSPNRSAVESRLKQLQPEDSDLGDLPGESKP
ncbi:O-antigen ligase family protein [bacterium]|nr:O-antigen ligase family protein [bacterium]